MAIFHLSVKAISRSQGRSATASAAYRAAEEIIDLRTGEVHDYRKKGGVESATLVLPKSAKREAADGQPAVQWTGSRADLWNAAEAAEKRKDACVAREVVVALPAELNPAQRKALALAFAQDMADEEGCAVDACMHAPGREGDDRNYHVHFLRTTRVLTPEGLSGKLKSEKAGQDRKANLNALRERWATLCNEHLQAAGLDVTIDHRSNAVLGLEELPSVHLGPTATAIVRKGRKSQIVEREKAKRDAFEAAVKQIEASRALEISRLESELCELHSERTSLELDAALAAHEAACQAEDVERMGIALAHYASASNITFDAAIEHLAALQIEHIENAMRWVEDWADMPIDEISKLRAQATAEPKLHVARHEAPESKLDDEGLSM